MYAKSNRKIFDTLISRTKIYLAIIFILLVIVCIEKPKNDNSINIIIFGNRNIQLLHKHKKKTEISETLQDLTLTVDSAAKTTLINSPFPLIILEADGNVIWKSAKFITEFANIDINTYIADINADIKSEIKIMQIMITVKRTKRHS